jgi:hypothetical protein
MADINQVTSSIVAGWVVSCGVVLVAAGASKLYRGARDLDGGTAVRRVLRMPRHQWRRAELAVGGLEGATAILVCSGANPVLGGIAMAALASVFCVLLGYMRVKRVPGDCGCIGWRPAPETTRQAVTWRAMARSGMLLGAGLAGAIGAADVTGASGGAWFAAGLLAGGTVLALLSVPMPVLTPVCRRPLWRGTRTALRALAGQEIFAAMTASAGPFEPVAWHRRTGCTDEFWFRPAAGPSSQAVVFRMSHAAPGGRLAVHASRQDSPARGTTWPAQALSVPNVPGASPPGDAVRHDKSQEGSLVSEGRRYEIPGRAR